jgi:hypothetical protein
VYAFGACAVLLASACAGSSRTDRDYALKAANTAEAVVSAIGTARVGVRAVQEDRVSAAYLSVLLREAADDAAAAQDTFDTRQPPTRRSDDLRDELDALTNDAVSVLEELRTAVRRGELKELPGIAAPLAELSEKLDTFERDHS